MEIARHLSTVRLSARIVLVMGIALILCACAPASRPGSTRALPVPDHVVPVWYMGIPVVMRSFELNAQPFMVEEDIPEDLPYSQVVSYIVGVVDVAIGASPARTLEGPGARKAVMPGHQGVIACLNEPQSPALGVAYAVVPGPKANGYNLRADEQVEGSVIGAPLATHVRIGPSWVPLTSHTAIEYGLHKGILRLRFFGANPVGWATPDWDDNYAPMPELAAPCNQPRRADRAFLSNDANVAPIPAH